MECKPFAISPAPYLDTRAEPAPIATMSKGKDEYSEAEAKRRFEQALKGAAKAPTKPAKSSKKKKS
jgi:hypothetical protein